MVHYIAIEIKSNTASFKNPDFQNFHKTLSLPPVTTIIGMGGAALGLSPKESQNFFYENQFHIGIAGQSKGRAKDIWKFIKETNSDKLHRHQLFSTRSIVTREILYFNQFVIVFGNEDELLLEKLSNSFLNPKYALTMGNSDSLAFIKNVVNDNYLSFSKNNKIEHCLVKGDVVTETIQNAKRASSQNFSIYQSPESTILDLPIRFEYENGGYGKRKITDSAVFSFIKKEMELNYAIEGILYKNLFIPTFKL